MCQAFSRHCRHNNEEIRTDKNLHPQDRCRGLRDTDDYVPVSCSVVFDSLGPPWSVHGILQTRILECVTPLRASPTSDAGAVDGSMGAQTYLMHYPSLQS